MDSGNSNIPKKENPVRRANPFSELIFWWLRKIFITGYRRPLNISDLYSALPVHQSGILGDQIEKLWKMELPKAKPSLLMVLLKAFGVKLILYGIFITILETALRVTQPLLIGGLISYFTPGQTDVTRTVAYYYAGGIVLCLAIDELTFHPYMLWVMHLGIKMKIACCSLIYRKALRMTSASSQGLSGQVINLLSNDVQRFDWAGQFLHELWRGPFMAFIFGLFIYREMGYSALIGASFMVMFIPFQAWCGIKSASLRLRTAARTDARINLMNEIITGIQVIKMHTWEKSFAQTLADLRRKEINLVRKSSYIRAALLSFSNFTVRVSIFLCVVTYLLFDNDLTPRNVFVVTSFFNILGFSVVELWPLSVTVVAEGYTSVQRIQSYLLNEETKTVSDRPHKDQTNGTTNFLEKKHNYNHPMEDIAILFKNVTAYWNDEISSGILDINLQLSFHKLTAIVGSVGSGKSSLLQAILKELNIQKGTLEIHGTISYASQEPWLFESSVRSNILFGDTFDEARYFEVIRCCALEQDLQMFQHGDKTLVGEGGVSLSGGQRSRINLARAIYKQADIYLLDDPLSAVDPNVGNQLFKDCITGYLNSKCVVLVTHQVHYLQNVEHIVMMQKGQVLAQGSFEDVKAFGVTNVLRDISSSENIPKEEETLENQYVANGKRKSLLENNPKVEEEKQSTGRISSAVYGAYFKAVGSNFLLAVVAISFTLSQIVASGSDYWMSFWVNLEQERSLSTDAHHFYDADEINQLTISKSIPDATYTGMMLTTNNTILNDAIVSKNDDIFTRTNCIYIYSGITVALMVITFHRSFMFYNICMRASMHLHNELFAGLTRARMSFFNTNASGRILNRFSKDIGAIDVFLPVSMVDSIVFVLQLIGIFTVVAVVNYYLLVPTFILAIFFYFMKRVYLRTSRSLKRLEGVSRSPVFTHVNASLQGLTTIRAFRKQQVLIDEFDAHQDLNTSASYMVLATSRGFAFWLDMISVLYILVVTLSFLVLENDTLGGNVGLAITQVNSLISMCNWGMRQTAELENQMTSVERVVEYTHLESEPPLDTIDKTPLKNWPASGNIIFKNVSLKYNKNAEYALRDLNFKIVSEEKIGIVGRTGSGKSSLIIALFRLAEFEGIVEIDGLNTNELGLHDLRSKISVIPQEPFLFSGTLRNNLDPFQEISDENLWNALAEVEMKTMVSELSAGLNTQMSDGGSNFSVGQRQLICLARAILGNNKIIVLDEATANVDPETDRLIQKTIRGKFRHCTVLTVAHRINTVIDNDRIIVMDKGRVVEMGEPERLMQNNEGILRQLMDSTDMAEQVYKK